ncbi:1-phosphofructokinase [Microbacterium natoriense]|uniref:1-phosphofructokinase n=1 Tax=Microbacterium natoriense TaxID=284570 RepID=A0AAW8EX25_9MICO|nr:hexose kinase [Microbacterium natoriense]MDQ0647375.1 1-phosphofructokinase [Microbacterium natoriense]
MIVTFTANPALDRTITLGAALRPGEVQTADSVREDAGGKGVNVSRVVAVAGVETIAVLPVAVDDPYGAIVAAAGVPMRAVPVARHVRTNLTIADHEGVTTKINLSGEPLADADAVAVTAAVVEACEGARWLVLAGSLPGGVADSFYVDIAEAVRTRWGGDAPRIAVDTSGPALREVVERGAADLIKPNDEELVELTGLALDEGALADAVHRVARRIVPVRAASALVTLGGAGAVLVTAEGTWFAEAPRIKVASTVGAGDSSLAGYLLAEHAGLAPAVRLQSAIRYGAAAASLPGTQAPTPADLGTGDIAVRSL